MNIRLAVNGLALLSPLTGIGQYTRQLSIALMGSGQIDASFFYGFGWSKQLRPAPQAGIVEAKGMFKQYVPKAYEVSRALMQLAFSAGKPSKKFDIYHEPGFLPFKASVPTIITVHDLSYIRYPEMHPADRAAYMIREVPKALARASHVLVDSDFVRAELIDQYGIAPTKVETVHLGVSENFCSHSIDECSEVLQTHGLSFGRYILAVGTLEPRKNLISALKAYSALPMPVRREYPLVLVGMKGWLSEEFDRLVQPLMDMRQVKWLGYIHTLDLPKIYSGATLFIYPSLYEGFGLPPLEAMACGVPVVASNQASLPEVLGTAGWQLDPYDIDGLRNSMLGFIESPVLRAAHAKAGVDRAKLFSWERCAIKTLAVYQKVLDV